MLGKEEKTACYLFKTIAYRFLALTKPKLVTNTIEDSNKISFKVSEHSSNIGVFLEKLVNRFYQKNVHTEYNRNDRRLRESEVVLFFKIKGKIYKFV